MNNMMESSWYESLIRPDWAPPSWIFGPVWTVLYILIGISFGYATILYIRREIPFKVILPFIINIVANLIFTPIQFGLRNNFLAAIDILIVLVTIIWIMLVIKKYRPWIANIQIPYLLWVSFATILQLTITVLNW